MSIKPRFILLLVINTGFCQYLPAAQYSLALGSHVGGDVTTPPRHRSADTEPAGKQTGISGIQGFMIQQT